MQTPNSLTEIGSLRGKRVLVTGHTGFKGSWLVTWLHQLGAQVYGLSLPALPGGIFEKGRIDQLMQGHRIGDVRDLATVREVFDTSAPDLVFHMAAQPLVRRSFVDPIETIGSNIMGTAHVLEALRLRTSNCACVVITSDKCYEPADSLHRHVETDRMGGRDPYSMSKGAAELVVASYRTSFFSTGKPVTLASVRGGNCIGGGDVSPDRLVVDALRGLRENKPIEIRMPRSVRPWQHLLDPLSGYLLLGAKLLGPEGTSFAEPFNFGPDDAAEVREVLDRLTKLWGSGSWTDVSGGQHPPEVKLLMLDATKAKTRLGWAPRLPLQAALKWTVDWERQAHDAAPAKVVDATRAQIEAFTANRIG